MMKISKQDALMWFEFFSQLDEECALMPRQMEIAFSAIAQIETAVEKMHSELIAQIPGIKTLCGRTYYVGDEKHFPKGCVSCLCGTGLSAVRKTNKCNACCRFCYDYGVLDQIPPIGEGMWDIGGTRFREEDIELLLSTYKAPSGIAYVYLEPFMEIEKYYGIIKRFSEHKIYQHMYTNGISCTEQQFEALGNAGLDELRFNIGASNCSDRVIKNIALAKKYIPMVGIETPMTREIHPAFMKKRDKVLETGLDFINFAELHLNPNNLGNYEGENMYMYRHGYVSPIISRVLTLETMRTAAEENWDIVVHDCSNRTKFARDLNLRAAEGGWFGQSSYGSEFERIPFEAFLPVLSDDSFEFLEEEELPEGYRPGDIVL